MAHLQGRHPLVGEVLQPVIRLRLLLLILLSWPALVAGQEGTDPSSTQVGFAASTAVKVSSVDGEARAFFGGWAGLSIGDRVYLGGGGYAMSTPVDVAGSGPGTTFELGLGYGGVVVGYQLPLGEGPWWIGANALLGAGNAEVLDPIVGTEIGSDNFFVGEPEVSLGLQLSSHLNASLGAGYRLVAGVGDLAGLRARELRAFTGTLALHLTTR